MPACRSVTLERKAVAQEERHSDRPGAHHGGQGPAKSANARQTVLVPLQISIRYIYSFLKVTSQRSAIPAAAAQLFPSLGHNSVEEFSCRLVCFSSSLQINKDRINRGTLVAEVAALRAVAACIFSFYHRRESLQQYVPQASQSHISNTTRKPKGYAINCFKQTC